MTDALCRLLIDASLRVAVLAIFVSAILALLRVHSSGVRHAVWTAFLFAMLAMPVLPSILPGIVIPTPAGLPLVSSAVERASFPLITDSGFSPSVGSSPVVREAQSPPSAAAAVPVASSFPVPAQRNGAPLPWHMLAAGMYASGVSVSLLALLIGWRAADRVRRASQPVPISVELSAPIAFDSRLRIHESAVVVTPVTIGIYRPAIILPRSWRSWSGDTLSAVLAHETAHVTRRDPFVFFLARINRCLFWFHPVAWWLERRLAATAEHASDEQAVRAIGERQRYAEILLDMARTVSRQGGRLSWQGVGIRGDGLLGHRIDRVLEGTEGPLPVARKFLVAGSCATVLLIAAACQLVSSATSYELTPAEAKLEEQIRTTLEALEWHAIEGLGPYRNVTRQDVAALEAAVGKNPEDMDAARSVLVAYWNYGTRNLRNADPRTELRAQDPTMAGARRDRILWLIAHHPESDLSASVEGRIFQSAVVPAFPADPDGYQRAKALWLEHVGKRSVSALVLGNASHFFETSEPSLAEQLLLRARASDPQGPWAIQLGILYGSVLTSFDLPHYASRLGGYRSSDPFAQGVRRKLGESTDEAVLTAAGWRMTRGRRSPPPMDFDEQRDWAEDCFKRVLLLDPKAVFAHAEMLAVRKNRQRSTRPLWNPPLSSRYESVSALPDAERFEKLPELARTAYHDVVADSRWNDPNLSDHIAIEKTQARLFSEDALKLASQFRDHPRYGTAILTANLTLGSLALADGDRKLALDYLHKASRAPASEELVYGRDIVCGMFVHLPGDLLALGERAAVADYLQRMATISLADRSALREMAAAIRRGETPNLSVWNWSARL